MNFFKKISIVFLALATLCVSCGKDNGTDEKKTDTSSFAVKDSYGNSITTLTVLSDSTKVTLSVVAEGNWELEIPAEASWVTSSAIEGAGNQDITIAISKNTTASKRSADLFFLGYAKKGTNTMTLTITQKAGSGDDGGDTGNENLMDEKVAASRMVDIKFNVDGTATDLSPLKNSVNLMSGASLVTYYNATRKDYVARFNHNAGQSSSEGYYKVDYFNNETFASQLEDGHTIECMFMLDYDLTGTTEIKPFSSMEAGGTGFLISTTAEGGPDITFLPNVTSTGSSNWIWCHSNVKPERGVYYHVVGVYDKANKKAKIYVNGALKGSVDAAGDLKLPSDNAKWFCIGGDASTSSTCQSEWKGDIVIARVFDAALTDTQVSGLWKLANKNYDKYTIQLENITFLSGLAVKPGTEYIIGATGMHADDQIQFLNEDGSSSYTLTGTFNSVKNKMTVILPTTLISGKYKLLLIRGTQVAPLGTADLTVSNDADEIRQPLVVAHRGYHLTSTCTENSLAALKAAQTNGYDYTECDVHITTDGEVYVLHDSSLKGTNIEKNPSSVVGALTLSNGEPLPTLKSFLEQLGKGKMKLIIEIKTEGATDNYSAAVNNNRCVDSTVALVKRYGLRNKVEYIGFSIDNCKRVIEDDPDAIVGYLGGNITPAVLHGYGIKSIDYQNTVLSEETIKAAHELGMTVNVWTVDGSDEMMSWMLKKVDYITTNYPNYLQSINNTYF